MPHIQGLLGLFETCNLPEGSGLAVWLWDEGFIQG